MYRYERVVNQVQEWVATGALKPGDRLLSVREMSTKTGCSTVTVYQAYGILQDEGILEARPRSGFYISQGARPLPEFTALTADADGAEKQEPADAGRSLPFLWRQSTIESFGSDGVSEDLMPYDELYRSLASHLRWEAARRESASPQGVDALRETIAKRSAGAFRTDAGDIVVTRGTAEAIRLGLDLTTRPGSQVLVETPMDAACVSAVLGRKVGIVEIYSHPRFGVDPEQFQYLLENNDVCACILSPINHAPTGVSYPLEAARLMAEAATRKGIPIIENMAGRDLIYDAAPFELAQFGTRDLVLRVGSFAETLGPRFGLGWVAVPRKYRVRLTREDGNVHRAGDWAMQQTIAEYLGKRSYERHLRRLREQLSSRMLRGLSLIFQRFPESCTVSRPVGGYLCWIRGPKAFNAMTAAKAALAMDLSISPGPLFSVTRAFGNFVALNLSHPWTPERERHIGLIGDLMRV